MATSLSNPVAYFNYDYSNPSVKKFLDDEDKQYKVFTGADISAFIGNKRIGKLQGITCSVTREVMPIYTTGDPNPKAFAKGKRGIAGNLVFTQFDKHAILRDLIDTSTTGVNGNSTLQNIWSQISGTNTPNSTNSNGNLSNPNNNWGDLVQQVNQTSNLAMKDLLETYYLVSQRKVNYVDMIPPFDITVTMVNEAGNAAVVSIHGVQLINEGWGYTLDDMHSETAYTYVARAITPLSSVDSPQSITV